MTSGVTFAFYMHFPLCMARWYAHCKVRSLFADASRRRSHVRDRDEWSLSVRSTKMQNLQKILFAAWLREWSVHVIRCSGLQLIVCLVFLLIATATAGAAGTVILRDDG